jgi:hypothetical protein
LTQIEILERPSQDAQDDVEAFGVVVSLFL